MQRTANLITALTALALAVAFVTGVHFQTQRTDAAAGTIAAINVGTCHTTDASVLDEADCNPHRQIFQFNRDSLDNAFEVDELYATYAHDPKTADEPPRAILKDADLIKISIKDEGRDVRSGVIVNSYDTTNAIGGSSDMWAALNLASEVRPDLDDPASPTPTPETEGAVSRFGGVVAAAISQYDYPEEAINDPTKTDVPVPQTAYRFTLSGDLADRTAVTITEPGIEEILFVPVGGTFDASDAATAFKPIASGANRGEMRFFGSVENHGPDGVDGGGDDLDIPFGELDRFLTWDEDVEPGTPEAAPAVSIQANLRAGDTLTLRAIYYLTSEVEYMLGGEMCIPAAGIPETSDGAADGVEKGDQVACTEDELGDDVDDYDNIKLDASADGVQSARHLYLEETDRFTGIFNGYLRLTDSDGDGGDVNSDGERVANTGRINWGRVPQNASGPNQVDADGDFEGAILGVDNGPVRVTYKDTDGVNRTFVISIDIGTPTINVTSPTHNGRNDDEEVNFQGTINDGESGLAQDSFVLYLDHSGDTADANWALDLPVVSGETQNDNDLGNVEADPDADDGVIATETQYSGFTDDAETYGVVIADKIYPTQSGNYDVDDDESDQGLKGMEAENYANGDSDAEFRDSIRINFLQGEDDTTYNHKIDFHAVVRDTAGNIGFSDSDEAAPRYINDLGTKVADRKIPNVLGVFSAHAVFIDNVDPIIDGDKTVTGFYGTDNDDDPIVDRAGVMVVFDGPIDERNITENTFMLTTGEGDNIETLDIIEAIVDGKLVFLKLADELPSDAEPSLTIANGEEVRDLAGRVTRSDEQDPVTVNDGNLPVFTVSLGDGSGLGDGAEGPEKLTKDTIKVSISSDEDIQGAPKVSVVCSNLSYPGVVAADGDRDVSDYVTGLSGAKSTTSATSQGQIAEGAKCGNNDFALRQATSLSRRGNQWEYTWRQFGATGEDTRVPDGMATVVVWGNDRSQYDHHDDGTTIQNWGSAQAEFRFDNQFESPLEDRSGGRVLPGKDSEVAERRPFVLLDFSGEPTSVTVTELIVDGVDVTADIDSKGQNQFLYWPETLSAGEHEVKFSANDAANNKVENESFKFEVTSRDPFVLSLFAGWNAISFPADPKENALADIFEGTPVERVIGWLPGSRTGPWAVATKTDGVWTTSLDTATLTNLRAQYGYWVYSTAFGDVSVELQGPIDRETGGLPGLTGVPTYPGWNFVGVVDQDGDQTEGRAGTNLKDGIINLPGEANVGEQDDMLVKDYLSGFARAYRWDVITNSYRVLKGNDNLKIGEGIWAYFDDGIAP